MTRKLKVKRHKQELTEFLGKSFEVAYSMYIAQKKRHMDTMKTFLFRREDLQNEFFEKFEINAETAIEIKKTGRLAWEKAYN